MAITIEQRERLLELIQAFGIGSDFGFVMDALLCADNGQLDIGKHLEELRKRVKALEGERPEPEPEPETKARIVYLWEAKDAFTGNLLEKGERLTYEAACYAAGQVSGSEGLKEITIRPRELFV